MALVPAVMVGSSTSTLIGLGSVYGSPAATVNVNIQIYCYYDGGLEAGKQFIDGSTSILQCTK